MERTTRGGSFLRPPRQGLRRVREGELLEVSKTAIDRAVRDFITSRKSSMVMYLSFHSWGQMVLYPWGYDSTVRAKDQAELHRVGQIGARALGGYKVLIPEQ